MAASMVGSALVGLLIKRYRVESYMRGVFVVSAVVMLVPLAYHTELHSHTGHEGGPRLGRGGALHVRIKALVAGAGRRCSQRCIMWWGEEPGACTSDLKGHHAACAHQCMPAVALLLSRQLTCCQQPAVKQPRLAHPHLPPPPCPALRPGAGGLQPRAARPDAGLLRV
jgi:hypothetical protein